MTTGCGLHALSFAPATEGAAVIKLVSAIAHQLGIDRKTIRSLLPRGRRGAEFSLASRLAGLGSKIGKEHGPIDFRISLGLLAA